MGKGRVLYDLLVSHLTTIREREGSAAIIVWRSVFQVSSIKTLNTAPFLAMM